MPSLSTYLTSASLPASGLFVGRVWDPAAGGPCVVKREHGSLVDITDSFPTMRDLCEAADPATAAKEATGRILGTVDHVMANTAPETRDASKPWLLAPIDLQALKAAGVTFATSMLERVIEERARGNPAAAAEIRTTIGTLIGSDLSKLRAGSAEAMELKKVLIEKGAWSQYLEVGIGPDAEIFTKSQLMAAVGHGMEAGLNPVSTWNNPEPEVVLVVASTGRIVGAMLGNDVNLRDVEGRSALLLGKAKDNNASCAVGPMIRLFDATFSLDHVRRMQLSLKVEGEDGYVLNGASNMSKISRDPADLVGQMIGPLSSVSGRRGAVPRHHVRARRGSRCAGQGLHPQAGRHRHHLLAGTRHTGQPHDHLRHGAPLDLWRQPPDAQPGEARSAAVTAAAEARTAATPRAVFAAAVVQHFGLAIVTLAIPRLVAQASGADDLAIENYVQIGMVALGIATLSAGVGLARHRLGLSAACVLHRDICCASLAVAASEGLGAVAGLAVVAGITQVVLSRFLGTCEASFRPMWSALGS